MQRRLMVDCGSPIPEAAVLGLLGMAGLTALLLAFEALTSFVMNEGQVAERLNAKPASQHQAVTNAGGIKAPAMGGTNKV